MQKKTFIIICIILVILLGIYILIEKQGLLFIKTSKEKTIRSYVSQAPRNKIIIYIVPQGETLKSISEKFDISVNTIKWANNMSDERITKGESLKILPVTGVAHVVMQGETIESIAKKYHIDKQKIIDYPFNQFANSQTFSLIIGETLIVPDGTLPN